MLQILLFFMPVTVIYYCYFCNTLHKARQNENSLKPLYLLGFLLYDKTRQHYTKSKLRGCILIPDDEVRRCIKIC